jgi:hypothetical protein
MGPRCSNVETIPLASDVDDAELEKKVDDGQDGIKDPI